MRSRYDNDDSDDNDNEYEYEYDNEYDDDDDNDDDNGYEYDDDDDDNDAFILALWQYREVNYSGHFFYLTHRTYRKAMYFYQKIRALAAVIAISQFFVYS